MNDSDNKIALMLFSGLIRSEKEEFEALECLDGKLDPKRLGR